jgi:hypothetical protein
MSGILETWLWDLSTWIARKKLTIPATYYIRINTKSSETNSESWKTVTCLEINYRMVSCSS